MNTLLHSILISIPPYLNFPAKIAATKLYADGMFVRVGIDSGSL